MQFHSHTALTHERSVRWTILIGSEFRHFEYPYKPFSLIIFHNNAVNDVAISWEVWSHGVIICFGIESTYEQLPHMFMILWTITNYNNHHRDSLGLVRHLSRQCVALNPFDFWQRRTNNNYINVKSQKKTFKNIQNIQNIQV